MKRIFKLPNLACLPAFVLGVSLPALADTQAMLRGCHGQGFHQMIGAAWHAWEQGRATPAVGTERKAPGTASASL